MSIKALDLLGIPYILTETKVHKLSIIVTKDAIVKIRYHKSISMKKINEYVEQHIDWIKQKYLTFYVPKRQYVNNEHYLILGNEYKLDIVSASTNKVFIDGEYLVIYTKSQEKDAIKKLIDKYIKSQAEDVFNILLEKCFSQMANYLKKYPTLQIKKYKSRWGCCYPTKDLIILNLSLIHVPTHLIEFVIYHELTHFKFMDHQAGFHAFLKMYVPNEKALRKELEKYRTTYE